MPFGSWNTPVVVLVMVSSYTLCCEIIISQIRVFASAYSTKLAENSHLKAKNKVQNDRCTLNGLWKFIGVSYVL